MLSAKLFGEGGSYDSDVYRAVFELAPSTIAVLAEDDPRKAYVKVNAAIAKGVPESGDAAAKTVLAAHVDYAKAYGSRETADKILGAAEKAEAKARDNWHTAIRQDPPCTICAGVRSGVDPSVDGSRGRVQRAESLARRFAQACAPGREPAWTLRDPTPGRQAK
ncbi:MAG: hypothetical protein EXR77_18225 [Myxococcales bacterium]|nr:hypothetical protein [Myxococcales bacterium]